mmetsp:Transcript_6568/g.19772  ORF Transcript_6568/g.19772 Transcript_6568/m.19772 type:complete len:730 (-) Transcript_6568:100-2289(-)
MGSAIAAESRAMQSRAKRHFEYRTGASSVINIARDGRWGRLPETYGECPHLTSMMAVAFNKGLIGFPSLNSTTPPAVYKTVPVLRHFGAYAGPDHGRFRFDASVRMQDLYLTFLPAWRSLHLSGALPVVMSAISALNGAPGIADSFLLNDVLRSRWRWDGLVMSDCDTFPSLERVWGWAASAPQSAALALSAGNDMNCGVGFAALSEAVKQGYISRVEVATAARRALRLRMRVGELQPPASDPWARAYPLSVVGCAAHAAINERIVAGGTVVLGVRNGALPINLPKEVEGPSAGRPVPRSHNKVATIALIGPSADDPSIQAHTYHGTPAHWITLRAAMAEELRAQGAMAQLAYAQGCETRSLSTTGFAEALALAREANAVVFAGGLAAGMEEEDTDRTCSPDSCIGLPGVQLPLLHALRNVTAQRGVPLITLLISGGPISEPSLKAPSPLAPDALLWTSYFGQSAQPLAKILLGGIGSDGYRLDPTGRLPFTIPTSQAQLPVISDYRMDGPPAGRTYRYLDTESAPPLYPFGYATSLPSPVQESRVAHAPEHAVRRTGLSDEPTGSVWRASRLSATPSVLDVATLLALARASDPLVGAKNNEGVADESERPGLLLHFRIAGGHTPVAPAFLVFGSLEGQHKPSPFPRRQMIAFTKPLLTPGKNLPIDLAVSARDLVWGLGIGRQPVPGVLRLWVGDALGPEGGVAGELRVPIVERPTNGSGHTPPRDEL